MAVYSMYMYIYYKLQLQWIKCWQEVEELMSLAPEKVLLKWMNFHLKKAGYKKQVTNFSSDLKVRETKAFTSDTPFLN